MCNYELCCTAKNVREYNFCVGTVPSVVDIFTAQKSLLVATGV